MCIGDLVKVTTTGAVLRTFQQGPQLIYQVAVQLRHWLRHSRQSSRFQHLMLRIRINVSYNLKKDYFLFVLNEQIQLLGRNGPYCKSDVLSKTIFQSAMLRSVNVYRQNYSLNSTKDWIVVVALLAERLPPMPRSAVQIQSTANFIMSIFTVNCRKDQNKEKRSVIAH